MVSRCTERAGKTYESQGAQRGVVGIAQVVDHRMQFVSSCLAVLDFCGALVDERTFRRTLTVGLLVHVDDLFRTVSRAILIRLLIDQQRDWKIAEESLQDACDAVDVVKEVFRIAKVDAVGV